MRNKIHSRAYDLLFLPHLFLAASVAISFLSFADSFAALAFPPFSPPLRPIFARYSEIGDLSSFGCSSCPSVDMRTISKANLFGSLGNGLLERLMHMVCQRLLDASRGEKIKMSHYPLSLSSWAGNGTVHRLMDMRSLDRFRPA